jgi:3-methyladenine DNA glycosylase/8-oxoguanine DNA glycosylase
LILTDTIAADLSPGAYRQAAKFLSDQDADWARHFVVVGPCRHEPKPAREPFEALVRAIAYQQLHAKAPTPRQMRDIGEAWSPWRTVAAWYLWRLPSR